MTGSATGTATVYDELDNSIKEYLNRNAAVRRWLWSLLVLFIALLGAGAYELNSYLNPVITGVALGMALMVFWTSGLCVAASGRTRSSARALRERFGLSQSLDRGRYNGTADEQVTALRTLAADIRKGLEPRSARLDIRLRNTLTWMASTALAIAEERASARYLLTVTPVSTDTGFHSRTLLLGLTHSLLFVGIVITFGGLFYAFSQENLSMLISPLAGTQQLDMSRLPDIMAGFTLAFGATATGYVAYLTARFQADFAERDSEEFGDVLENGLIGAFRRALAPLTSVQQTLDPRIGDEVTHLNKLIADHVGQRALEVEEVLKSINETMLEVRATTLTLRDNVTQATTALGDFGSTATTLITAMGTTSGSLRDSASTISREAQIITRELGSSVAQIRTTIDEGIGVVLKDVAEQTGHFRQSLEEFRKEIDRQVGDFKQIQSELGEGRRHLADILAAGGAERRAMGARIEAALATLQDTIRRFEAGLGPVNGALRGVPGLDHRLQLFEEELGRLLRTLDRMVIQIRTTRNGPAGEPDSTH